MAIRYIYNLAAAGLVLGLLRAVAVAGEPPGELPCPSVDIGAVASAGSAQGDSIRERAARRLIDVARLDLVIGRVDDGCRMLLVVATTFADTESGRTVRRELGSANVGGSTAAPGLRDVGGAALSKWQEVVIRATAAQDELREAVGDRVFFGQGSAEIGARAAEAVNAQAGWLALKGEFDVVIEGHADDGLSETATQALAAARAEAVRRAFVLGGLPPERISVLALGGSEPIAACEDAACAAQNRRAVTRLVPVSVGSGR